MIAYQWHGCLMHFPMVLSLKGWNTGLLFQLFYVFFLIKKIKNIKGAEILVLKTKILIYKTLIINFLFLNENFFISKYRNF